MPLFDAFLPVIQDNTIENWTSNDFWKKIKLSKKERNRFNRQRMYRILRKLVEFGFLVKKINHENHRFSRFHETNKTSELKLLGNSKAEISNMQLEEIKISTKISFLEIQTEQYVQLEKNYPYLSHQISFEKEKCLSMLLELKAYRCALKSVINTI